MEPHVVQVHIILVAQNILSIVKLKNVKVFNENVRLHLATPEICQVRNLWSKARGVVNIIFSFKCFKLTKKFRLAAFLAFVKLE